MFCNFCNAEISFDEAKFLEEGILINNLSTFSCLENPYFEIEKVFFFFGGKDYCFENVVFKHNMGLEFHAEKARFTNNFYEIHNMKITNSKKGFANISKISSLGKLSVLDCELGYKEPMGWKFSSNFLTYDKDKIFCIGNKVGIGKVKIPFFNVVVNTCNHSGFIRPQFESDFEDYRYVKVGYYYLIDDKSWDLKFCPLIYFKDLGLETRIRSFDNNFIASLFLERLLSYSQYSNKKKNFYTNNTLLHFEGKNEIYDIDMFVFNFKLYDEQIVKKNNYKNFSFLNKNYWGYCYTKLGDFNVAFLQRNNQNYVKLQYNILDWLKFKIERDFQEEILNPFNKFASKLIAEKNFYEDFDVFLIDFRPRISYTCYQKEKVTATSLDSLGSELNLKIDCPFFYLDDENFVKFDFNFCFKVPSLTLLKDHFNKKFYEPIFAKNLNNTLHFQLGNLSQQVDVSFNDFSNYKFTVFSDSEIIDSFSLEVINQKIFFSIYCLNSNNCYGLKISVDQIMFESSFNFNDCVKLKFLGSYDFKNGLFSKSSFFTENSYINSSFEILTNSWRVNLGLGFQNLKSRFNYSFYFSITPNQCLSFEDIKTLLDSVNQEKKKLLDLYKEFQ